MGRLYEKILSAVQAERYLVSWHADERCEEREISAWDIVAALDDAELLRERPRSKPNPSVVVRLVLVDGTEVEAVWSWLAETKEALLVTVYFRD